MTRTAFARTVTALPASLEVGKPASMFTVIAMLAVGNIALVDAAMDPDLTPQVRNDLLEKIREQNEQIADCTELLNFLVTKQATTDTLTGVRNRNYFDTAIEAAMQASTLHGAPLALLAFDIDHFKSVNDTYGHAAGDKVLQIFARQIDRGLKNGDLVARYGGEEFFALLSGASKQQALEIADRLRLRVAARPGIVDAPAITVSIGVTHYVPGDTAATFKARADRGLYQAKADGRNCVAYVSATTRQAANTSTCHTRQRQRRQRKVAL